MNRISQQSLNGKVLVSDGAWGTMLQKKGMKPGECPELWCVEHRDAVLEIGRSYIAAGADMIKTNSFGGNRMKLKQFGLDKRVGELNEAAAAISREAAGNSRHVIASMGPTGKMLIMEDVTESEMYDAFSEQAQALEKGGADASLVETMMAVDEAALAVKAVKENTKLEIICTFTFARTVTGEYRTMMGASPDETAKAMTEAGAGIVGSNCGNGMKQMVDIVGQIRKATPGFPVIVHANAGMPVNVGGVDVFPETPEEMAGNAVAVVAAGAGIVGGCCGTTPAHITAIARRIHGLQT